MPQPPSWGSFQSLLHSLSSLILPSSSLPHFLAPATDGKLYRLASSRLALYLLHLLILLLPLLLLLLPVLVSPHCCSVGGAVLSVVPCPITADTCQGEAGCDTGGSQILARHSDSSNQCPSHGEKTPVRSLQCISIKRSAVDLLFTCTQRAHIKEPVSEFHSARMTRVSLVDVTALTGGPVGW